MRRPWLWALITLCLAVFAVYSNVYGNGFLLDDEFLLQKNRFIAEPEYFWRIFTSSSTMGSGGVDSFYRPMQTLLYFFVVQIFGLSIPALHALNVGLHALNAILIYGLATRRLNVPPLLAWSAALLWAVHPLHTEAVTYMSATADPLHTLFVLLAVLSSSRMWLATLFFALGLMSKESAIVAPLLIMAVDAASSRRPYHWRTHLRTWPLWLVVVVYLVLRKTLLNFDDTFSFYKEPNVYTEHVAYRILTFLGTLPRYFGLLVWPYQLHMERDFPVFAAWAVEPILGAIMVGGALAILFFERKRAFRPWSLAVLWFCMAHIPHTGVLLPVNSLFLEHWMYLPTIGLFVGFMAWISAYGRSFSVPVAVGGLIAATFLACATFRQNQVWASPVVFYENILKYAKGNGRVFNNLAMAYSESGQADRAIELYQRAIAAGDHFPQVRHNLAEEYMRKGELNEAIPHLKRAVEIDPRFYYSYRDLAAIYQRLGDQALADHYYGLYQKLRPE